AREAKRRKAVGLGLFEGELRQLREVEPRAWCRNTVGAAKPMGDRCARVGRAELRKYRAVGVIDEAVHDRLRMDDDVELVAVEIEEMMRFDHFEALVHHRRAI